MSPNGCSNKQLLLLVFGGKGKTSTLLEVCASNKCDQFVFLIHNREFALGREGTLGEGGGGGGGRNGEIWSEVCVTNKWKEEAGKMEKCLSQNWREKQVDLVAVPNPFSINGSNFT